MVEVLKAGLYDSIHDLGRHAVQEYGVPYSGVMDRFSTIKANALLGNHDNAAVLECTVSGPKLRFDTQTQICITGATMNARLNGVFIKNDRVIDINSNDVLSFGTLEKGCRMYIAVVGGFLTEEKMGSRSMYQGITSNFKVKKGDILPVNVNYKKHEPSFSSIKFPEDYSEDHNIQVLEGPEFNLLNEENQSLLFEQELTIANDSNRMAYQFEERFINDMKPIITSLVLPGTVQLTPSGQLIALMRDCQITGGYPRVLQLTEMSINTMSQKFFGDKIRLKRIKE
ncbi:5-oxoprolinase subunit C family protein [Psychroserpens sp. MEBiC05023]